MPSTIKIIPICNFRNQNLTVSFPKIISTYGKAAIMLSLNVRHKNGALRFMQKTFFLLEACLATVNILSRLTFKKNPCKWNCWDQFELEQEVQWKTHIQCENFCYLPIYNNDWLLPSMPYFQASGDDPLNKAVLQPNWHTKSCKKKKKLKILQYIYCLTRARKQRTRSMYTIKPSYNELRHMSHSLLYPNLWNCKNTINASIE